MWKKIRGVLLFLGTMAILILAYVFLGGKSGTGDNLFEEAKKKREKADLIDAQIARLKAESGKIDEETKKEIERIKKLDDLQEIADEFDKL